MVTDPKKFIFDPPQTEARFLGGKATGYSQHVLASNCGSKPCGRSSLVDFKKIWHENEETFEGYCQANPTNYAQTQCPPPRKYSPAGYDLKRQGATGCVTGYPLITNLMQNTGQCDLSLEPTRNDLSSKMDYSRSGTALGDHRRRRSSDPHGEKFPIMETVSCQPSLPPFFRSICAKNLLKWTKHQWNDDSENGLPVTVDKLYPTTGRTKTLIAASLCAVSKRLECFSLPTNNGTVAQHCNAEKKSVCRETCFPITESRSYNGGLKEEQRLCGQHRKTHHEGCKTPTKSGVKWHNCNRRRRGGAAACQTLSNAVCKGGETKTISGEMLRLHTAGPRGGYTFAGRPSNWDKRQHPDGIYCCYPGCEVPNDAPSFMRNLAVQGICEVPTKLA